MALVNEDVDLPKGPKFGKRHIQVILMFSLLAIAYASRFNVAVAIVAMTTNSSSNPDIPVYDWKDNGATLSSFYWGYVVFPIPAALLASKYGAKWFLITIMLVNATCCFIIPTMADNFGSIGLKACRVIQGLSQGFVYPSVHTMLGVWVPTNERSSLGGYVYSGTYIGNILGLLVTGLLSASWLGWPSSFYFFGVTNILWVLSMFFFGSSRPTLHKTITVKERNYIETSLGQANQKKLRTPWRSILTSVPFWAVFAPNLGTNFGVTMISTMTATYMTDFLGYSVSLTSILSAIPSGASWIGSLFFSPICDYLINKQYLQRKNARKLFNTLGMGVTGLILFAIGFVPQDIPVLTVVLFGIIGLFQAGYFCGYNVSFIDIAPNHAGTLMGISNGTTNLCAIIAPLIFDYIVTDHGNQSQWTIGFSIGALVLFLTNVIFCIFAQADIQTWNYEIEEENTESNIKTDIESDKNEKFRY